MLNSSLARFFLAMILGLAAASCVPLEARRPPTLTEVRLGSSHGAVAVDPELLPGEVRAEVLEVMPPRSEIRVRADDGRDRVMTYNIGRTSVSYHGWGYTVDSLEAGDRIAFQTNQRDRSYIDAIRILEPVQARTGPAVAQPLPPPPRSNVIEGTVERIQYERGVFDVRTRSGELFMVSLPYTARAADVESFRRLHTGDYVRLEGEFVNRDNLQLYSFLSPR
jgi:hypothetical protein